MYNNKIYLFISNNKISIYFKIGVVKIITPFFFLQEKERGISWFEVKSLILPASNGI